MALALFEVLTALMPLEMPVAPALLEMIALLMLLEVLVLVAPMPF